MPFPTCPPIESPRLLLRPVAASDLPDLLEVNGDPEVTRFLPYETWLSLADAEVNPENRTSCTLLQQVGFTFEGTLRQRWSAIGQTYDTNMYGLLADDPRPADGG